MLDFLSERVSRLREPIYVALLSVALGYLCLTEAALFVFGHGVDFGHLGDARRIDGLLSRRPALPWTFVLATLFGAAALLLVRAEDWAARWVRARRALWVLVLAAATAGLLLFLSPHARIAMALVLAFTAAVGGARLVALLDRPRSRYVDRALLWGVFLGTVAVYYVFSATRHANFGSGSWDLGCYNHSIWLASRFKPLMSTVLGDVHVIGDHFVPIVYLLAPVFWITESTSALLMVQALFVASTLFPIYWLAQRGGAGRGLALALGVSFLFAMGTQSAINFDFHEVTIGACFFAYALYFIETDRLKYAAPFLLLLFLTKESMSLYIAFIGLYLALFKAQSRGQRIVGIGLFIGGLGAFFLIVKWLMPLLLQGSKQGMIHLRFEQFAPTIEGAAVKMLMDPLRTAAIALNPALKVETLLLTFGAFGFLCFAAPKMLIIAIPLFAERLFTTKQTLWGMGFHYSVPLTLWAALAAAVGFRTVRPWLATLWERAVGWRPADGTVGAFLALCCVGMGVLVNGWGAGQPSEFASLRKPYFSKSVAINERALAVIPKDASVAAQNYFVAHLATREKIWLLEQPIRADYVIANPEDGAWPFDRNHVIRVLREVRAQGYQPIFSERTTVVFQKGARKTVPLSPEMAAILGP